MVNKIFYDEIIVLYKSAYFEEKSSLAKNVFFFVYLKSLTISHSLKLPFLSVTNRIAVENPLYIVISICSCKRHLAAHKKHMVLFFKEYLVSLTKYFFHKMLNLFILYCFFTFKMLYKINFMEQDANV